MRQDEAKDVNGMIAQRPKLRTGEAVDDEENWRRSVADHRDPEHGDPPAHGVGDGSASRRPTCSIQDGRERLNRRRALRDTDEL